MHKKTGPWWPVFLCSKFGFMRERPVPMQGIWLPFPLVCAAWEGKPVAVRENLRGAVDAVLRRFYQHQPQFDHLLNGQGQVAML